MNLLSCVCGFRRTKHQQHYNANSFVPSVLHQEEQRRSNDRFSVFIPSTSVSQSPTDDSKVLPQGYWPLYPRDTDCSRYSSSHPHVCSWTYFSLVKRDQPVGSNERWGDSALQKDEPAWTQPYCKLWFILLLSGPSIRVTLALMVPVHYSTLILELCCKMKVVWVELWDFLQ